MTQRIAKFLSESGVCSRREGERLIEEGRIKINNVRVDHPSTLVGEADVVTFDNRTVQRRTESKVWIFHKPKECITSTKDPEGRRTVFDILPKSFEHVKYVGRLDYWSEGLLLLTNDGAFARTMSLPVHEIPRVYDVRVYGEINDSKLALLRKGVTIDGIQYRPMIINILSNEGKNSWLEITLFEGKNREIRKVIEYIGCQVNRLVRIAFGPVQLEDLKVNQVREISINLFDSIIKDTI
jgi:23S rRNA pseudouridine2605 synthase